MQIIWTGHALERQKEWENKLLITKELVESIIDAPEQLIKGDDETLVAQSRFSNGLVRVIYKNVFGSKKIITLYWTSKVEKYWRIK